jgi:hypothetical protein
MSESDSETEEMGPVDYFVVEFAQGRTSFSGEMARELARLSHEGLIRVLDLVVIQKAANASVDAFEKKDVGIDEAPYLERDIAELLSAEDVVSLAAAMEPGSVAGVVVWENLWAAPFESATRVSGGQIIAGGRIPSNAIATSVEADGELRETLRKPARAARRGVVQAPVARVPATDTTAAAVAQGITRRQGRRQDDRDGPIDATPQPDLRAGRG